MRIFHRSALLLRLFKATFSLICALASTSALHADPAYRVLVEEVPKLNGGSRNVFPLEAFTVSACVATGTSSITDGSLGNLDPTLLENGVYQLRLDIAAFDGSGWTIEGPQILVDGNMKIGHFAIAFEDLSVPMPGLNISFTRSYDSRRTDVADFGQSWDLAVSSMRVVKNRPLGTGYVLDSSQSANISALVGQNIALWCAKAPLRKLVSVGLPDGSVMAFQPRLEVHPSVRIYSPSPDCSIVPQQQVKMVLVPVGNALGTLEPIDDLSDVTYPNYNDGPYGPGLNKPGVVRLQGGLLSKGLPGFDPIYEPTKFKYTSPEGLAFILEENKGVVHMEDRNANTLTFTENAITHSNGMAITFTRDAQKRITAITDPAGQQLLYAYDTAGRLISFTDRTSAVTVFKYENAAYPHYLTEIIDPLGNRAVKSLFDADGRLIGQMDADGNTVTMQHDIAAYKETITDRLGHPTVHEYDQNGNIIKTTDALGGITTRTYDARDRELTVTDPLGHTTSKTYDNADNVLTETNAEGETTHYTYNDKKQPLTITDPMGRVTTFNYDGNGNLLTMTDAAGNAVGMAYTGNGQLATMTDNLGNTTSYTYDSQTGVQVSQTVTTSSGHVVSHQTYEHDTLLRQTAVRDFNVPPGTTSSTGFGLYRRSQSVLDGAGRVTQSLTFDGGGNLLTQSVTTYNAAGLSLTSTDSLGRTSSQEYDDQGRSVKSIMPDGSFTTVSYDAEGRQISSTDALGRTSFTEYDALGRAVKHIAPDGTFTTTAYDAAGRMTSGTDARGNATVYVYDDAGRTTSVTNALNQTTTYTYDDAGRQTHMTDALGRTTETVYDEMGRPVKTIFANGSFTETGYDAAGRRTSSKDQAGTVTNYEYDAQSRLTAVVNALGHRTEYVYDNFGRQTQQKDALGRATSYQYDTLSRRIGRTLPMGQQESVAYDAAGQMLSRTDFNGRTTTFNYDVMGRLTTRAPSAAFSNEPAITYTYNAKGQRLTMTDATGTTTYGYDTRDRLTQKATPQGTLFYTYDAGGSLASITTSTSGGAAMTYTYDALNRLATVTDLNNQTTTYIYDAVGNLATTALPNGVTSTYSYNTLNRLLNLASEKSGNNVANYGYTLAATGHRLFAAETLGTITPATRVVSYTYDAIKRLTGESVTSNTSPNGATTWTYNEVSNRLTQTSTLPGIPNQIHSYDANDRLLSDTYDSNGNTLSGSLNTNQALGTNNQQPISGADSYDSQDRLISRLSSDGSYVTVKYNGEGHRVEQSVFRFATGTTTTTKWLVDNLNPTGYAQVVEEHTQETTSSSFLLTSTFTYGHDLISQDRRNLTTSQWDLSYYGYDGHGNVRYLTNAAGSVTDTYDYDAWGQLLNTTGTTQNPYLYTGEQYDPALGLYHLRARMMNPLTGRFWNMDTYEGNGADPASLHKYLYANADPVQGIDPSGKISLFELNVVSMLVSTTASELAINTFELGARATGSAILANAAAGLTAFQFLQLARAVPALIRGAKQVISAVARGTGWLLKQIKGSFARSIGALDRAPLHRFAIGTSGARAFDKAKLTALEDELAALTPPGETKWKVVPDSDAYLESVNARAAFRPATGELYLRSNPKFLDVYHEMVHARRRAELGLDKYQEMQQFYREQDVFNDIVKNEHLFTPEELDQALLDMLYYEKKVGPGSVPYLLGR